MKPTMRTVLIVPLGQLPEGLDLARVVKRANKAQKHYSFSLGEELEVATDPDADEEQYTFHTLAVRLGARRDSATQLLVGVTDYGVYDELFSAVDNDLSCIIVSTADIQKLIDADRTTTAGYVLFEIAAELLTIEYRRLTKKSFDPTECGAPWHMVRKSCIFDYDEERKHTGKKMLKPNLCRRCKSQLGDVGVASSIESAALRIASTGLTPFVAFVRRAMRHRLFTLVAGFVAGKIGLIYGLVVLAVYGLAVFWAERRH